MSVQYKAIETRYNGYRFRSRLEARWAIFLDTLGIAYQYEPEGFDLDGIWYLPDFWLPHHDCFVEIKGQEPTEEESEKAQLLAFSTGKMVYILWGNIGQPYEPHTYNVYGYPPQQEEDFGYDIWAPLAWGEDKHSGQIAILPFMPEWDKDDTYYTYCLDTPRLLAAYKSARSARFEFGQKGGMV